MFGLNGIEGGLYARAFLDHGSDEASHVVSPDDFSDRLAQEVARHHRYLHGVGLLRIGPRVPRLGVEALREAAISDTRRTDTLCLFPDGSCAVLAPHAAEKQLEIIARRLRATACAIHQESEGVTPAYAAGLAFANNRRIDTDELWLAVNRAYDEARQHAAAFVFAR